MTFYGVHLLDGCVNKVWADGGSAVTTVVLNHVLVLGSCKFKGCFMAVTGSVSATAGIHPRTGARVHVPDSCPSNQPRWLESCNIYLFGLARGGMQEVGRRQPKECFLWDVALPTVVRQQECPGKVRRTGECG
jgi:hypothetical protein